MKTFLAALAAGLIGGGAAVGVIALDLIPQNKATETAKSAAPKLDEGESATAPRDYESEITELKHQIDALEIRLTKQGSGEATATSEEVEALKGEIAALKDASKTAPRPDAEGEDVVDVEASPTVTNEFDSAVREVLTRVQEENAENRRLERQAERLQQLEERKTQIAEFIPNLVNNQAANLGIEESVVPDVSAALVTHAQYRAEIASEMQGLRIDDEEVDTEAYQQKFEELNQTTVAALTTYVDQETAERLVSTIARAGRNNRDGGGRQGRNGRR